MANTHEEEKFLDVAVAPEVAHRLGRPGRDTLRTRMGHFLADTTDAPPH